MQKMYDSYHITCHLANPKNGALCWANKMSASLKSALRTAVLRILEPLCAWMLDAGMGVGDLHALTKIAFIRAAGKQIRAGGAGSGRPTASRLAVVTGLTRADVSKILSESNIEPSSDRGRQRAER